MLGPRCTEGSPDSSHVWQTLAGGIGVRRLFSKPVVTAGHPGTYKEALSGLCREHKQKDGRDWEGGHIWRDTMQKGTTGDRRNKTSLVGESSDKGCLLSTFPSEGV